MYARVEDLRKGDVVLIAQGGRQLCDVKLLRQPQLAKVGKKTTWGGVPRWTSVLCSMREETLTQHYVNYQGNTVPYITKIRVVSNGKEHNTEKRVDFSEREVWIISRETI